MQWRFIATISKKGGEDCRNREKWKLCTYTESFWVATVWPCVSGEVDETNNRWQMFRTVNEYLVIFWGGARYQGYVVLCNMCCEPWGKLGYVPFHQAQKNLTYGQNVTLQRIGFDLGFFFPPSCLFVFLLTFWLPGGFGKLSIKPKNLKFL